MRGARRIRDARATLLRADECVAKSDLSGFSPIAPRMLNPHWQRSQMEVTTDFKALCEKLQVCGCVCTHVGLVLWMCIVV